MKCGSSQGWVLRKACGEAGLGVSGAGLKEASPLGAGIVGQRSSSLRSLGGLYRELGPGFSWKHICDLLDPVPKGFSPVPRMGSAPRLRIPLASATASAIALVTLTRTCKTVAIASPAPQTRCPARLWTCVCPTSGTVTATRTALMAVMSWAVVGVPGTRQACVGGRLVAMVGMPATASWAVGASTAQTYVPPPPPCLGSA